MARAFVVLLALAAGATAQETLDTIMAGRQAGLDIYVFSQDDDGGRGGNPYKAEGFDYVALRGEFTRKINARRSWRVNIVVAYISNDDPLDPPATVVNANTTSASGALTTADGLIGMDIQPEGSAWTYSPSFFYHHQIDYVGTGIDLGMARSLAGGDARIKLSYVLRYDFLELSWWDGSFRGTDNRTANNFLVAWEQNLSPSLRTNLSVQYTFQDGFLSDQYNFVTLFNNGVPVLYLDEKLPGRRHRVQVNARAKWSPKLGTSVGLDLSYYEDDWDIRHVSGAASFETLFGDLRWSAWYRLADQQKTKYFVDMPTVPARYQTQDSDLDSFTLHSAGMSFAYPLDLKRDDDTELRLKVWGFHRDDDVDGLGVTLGAVFKW